LFVAIAHSRCPIPLGIADRSWFPLLGGVVNTGVEAERAVPFSGLWRDR
jgi:hypothetical protein